MEWEVDWYTSMHLEYSFQHICVFIGDGINRKSGAQT
jgi:hypothetical protein